MRGGVLAVLSLAAACAAQAQFRVAGAVVDSVSGQALQRARMTLVWTERADRAQTVVSDAAGRFAFDPVPQGKYSLIADRQDYLRQTFGQKSLASGLATAVITGPKLDTEHLLFRMIRYSVIAGRVTDEQGEAVYGALVTLYRADVVNGARRINTRGYYFTNDLGEYRIYGLGAGDYYLAATGEPWYNRSEDQEDLEAQAGAEPLLGSRFLPVYYPNSRDPKGATPLRVKAGQEARADFVLPLGTGVNLSVRLPGTGRHRVTVSTAGMEGNETYLRTMDGYSDHVLFRGVPPGRYHVRMFRETAAAAREVEVGAADLEVELTPSMVKILGKVEVDGGGDARGGAVVLREEENMWTAGGLLRQDGSFTSTAMPGRYRVSLRGMRNTCLDSVTAEGAPVADETVDLRNTAEARLAIKATTSAGSVNGIVEREGRPLADVLLVLVPGAAIPGNSNFHAYQTDSDGSFEIHCVKAGTYRAVVFEDGAEVEYANRAVTGPLLSRAPAIEVGARETVDRRIEWAAR